MGEVGKEVNMAAQPTSIEKHQRHPAKKAKAAAKREKRLEKGNAEEEEETLAPLEDTGTELTAAELLARVEEIHRLFEAKKLSFEDFEEQKADLD
jgi:hypothetical protein